MKIDDNLKTHYPFLSIGKYGSNEYVGIIQNSSRTIVSMYVINDIKDPILLKRFMDYANKWWWESNRQYPINIFIGNDFKIFSKFIKSFNAKEFVLIHGPTVSISQLAKKRVKRKHINIGKINQE